MLSHEHVTPQPTGAPPVNPIHPSAAPNAASLEPLDSRLEEKLAEAVDQACAPLIGFVPRAQRLAQSCALHSELETLVAAHRELEVAPESAVDAAIAHFHRLHPVSGILASTQLAAASHLHSQQNHSLQTAPSPNQESRPAMLLSLGLLSSFYLAHIYSGAEWLRDLLGLSETALYRWELLGVPLCVGLIVGLIIRRRAVRGALFACGLLAIYAVLYPSLFCALGFVHLLPFEDSNLYRHIVPDPIAGYCGLTAWPLLTCAGAALGAKLRRHKR